MADEPYSEAAGLPDCLVWKAIETAWSKVNNGRYKVHLGALNWAEADFQQHPMRVACMILNEDLTLDAPKAMLIFDAACRKPKPAPANREPRGIVPEIASMLKRDIRAVLKELMNARYPNGRQILDLLWQSPENVIQDIDAEQLGIQMVVANIAIRFPL